MNPSNVDCPHVEVSLDTSSKNLYNFRYLSELEKEAKGGYLEGTIRAIGVPDESIVSVELDLVENTECDVHPNILFVTPNKRKNLKNGTNHQNEITPEDCFFTISRKEECWTVKTRYVDEFDFPKRKPSELVLGKDCLQLTIVKPSQKGEHKTKGLFLSKVLEAKLDRRNESHAIEEKKKWFASSKSSKDNCSNHGSLFSVYLCATFFLHDGTVLRGISQVPLHNKSTFKVELETVIPKRICLSGPSTIIVIMKSFKTAPVKFRLQLNGQEFEPSVKKYSQGTCYELSFKNIPSAGSSKGLLKVSSDQTEDVLSEEILAEPHVQNGRCWCVMNKSEIPACENGQKKRKYQFEKDPSDEFDQYGYKDCMTEDLFQEPSRNFVPFNEEFDPVQYMIDGATASSRPRGVFRDPRTDPPLVERQPHEENGYAWRDPLMIIVKIGLLLPFAFVVKRYLEN